MPGESAIPWPCGRRAAKSLHGSDPRRRGGRCPDALRPLPRGRRNAIPARAFPRIVDAPGPSNGRAVLPEADGLPECLAGPAWRRRHGGGQAFRPPTSGESRSGGGVSTAAWASETGRSCRSNARPRNAPEDTAARHWQAGDTPSLPGRRPGARAGQNAGLRPWTWCGACRSSGTHRGMPAIAAAIRRGFRQRPARQCHCQDARFRSPCVLQNRPAKPA